jgi:hypothetical protein
MVEHFNNLLNKADRIWNADESGFPFLHKSGKVMAPKGARTVCVVTSSSKQHMHDNTSLH